MGVFARAPDALPVRTEAERGVTVRDAMKDIRTRVRAVQVKGYTFDQICSLEAELLGRTEEDGRRSLSEA